LLGGRLAIHGSPGEGTTVTVSIPMEMVGQRPPAANSSAP